ncbi:nuclear transport factor 2 family protein [Massilia sp. TN1-12]|jgi:uncharacterized protein|uniref:nuclear transport factor 2 family protein n=1 Tax=Massilia paldalensis TaxID=3377675 RepID=UPI00384B8176
MSELNKTTLERANAAVRAGDNEGFLSFCTDDIVWSTVGGETLRGKQAVRDWMTKEYVAPPSFTVERLVAEGDFVVALGTIASSADDGTRLDNAYSDVWRFCDGKMAELRAFVIPTGT